MEAPRIEPPEYAPILSLQPSRDNLISSSGYIDQTKEAQFTNQLGQFRNNSCYSEFQETLGIASRLGNDVDLKCVLALQEEFPHIKPQTNGEKETFLIELYNGYINATVAAHRRAQNRDERNPEMHNQAALRNYQKVLKYRKQLDELREAIRREKK